MKLAKGKPFSTLPIKTRLTLWYLLLMGGIFSVIGFFIIINFRASLLTTVDEGLIAVASQAISGTENEDGVPSFQANDESEIRGSLSFPRDFAMRIVFPDNFVADQLGRRIDTRLWGTLTPGIQSTNSGEAGDTWRVFTGKFNDANNNLVAWIQVAQSLENVEEATTNLVRSLLLGIPVVLILAGISGYFLAGRSLRPISQITETARKIGANELSNRIDYFGPGDEIGQLANTFNAMLERLEESFEREKRFTSDAAHELRTPLGILKGQLEVTLRRVRKPQEYRRQLQSLQEHVERLIRLSNAMLYLSSFGKGKQKWDPEAIELDELLEKLLAEISPIGKQKELAFTSEIQNELFVWGDRDQLLQLFINLFDNAIKFSPKKGLISLKARENGTVVKVEMKNSGKFVSIKESEKLFEPFFRLDPSRSSEFAGAGLGLSIAKEIVEIHKGEIKASNDKKAGFIIEVTLPTIEINN